METPEAIKKYFRGETTLEEAIKNEDMANRWFVGCFNDSWLSINNARAAIDHWTIVIALHKGEITPTQQEVDAFFASRTGSRIGAEPAASASYAFIKAFGVPIPN